MAIRISIEPDVLEFDPAELEEWRNRDRTQDKIPYFSSLRGTEGFGEQLVGKHFARDGYEWIHHDFDLFGTNKPGKYLESEAVLRERFGVEELKALRRTFEHLRPFREPHHDPIETPDLMIFKRVLGKVTEVRFAESKREDTRDKLNSRQVLGLLWIQAILKCQVHVFVVRERGRITSVMERLEFSI